MGSTRPLLMYGSHDMRHTDFPQVDGGQQDPWEMGCHMLYAIFRNNDIHLGHIVYLNLLPN